MKLKNIAVSAISVTVTAVALGYAGHTLLKDDTAPQAAQVAQNDEPSVREAWKGHHVIVVVPTRDECAAGDLVTVMLDSQPIDSIKVKIAGEYITLQSHGSNWEFDCASPGKISEIVVGVDQGTERRLKRL